MDFFSQIEKNSLVYEWKYGDMHVWPIIRCHVGSSDHTIGIKAAIAAITLGARIIGNHLTLRGSGEGLSWEINCVRACIKGF